MNPQSKKPNMIGRIIGFIFVQFERSTAKEQDSADKKRLKGSSVGWNLPLMQDKTGLFVVFWHSSDDRLVLCPTDGGDKPGGGGGGGARRASCPAGTKLSLCHEWPSLRCYHWALPSTRPKGTDSSLDTQTFSYFFSDLHPLMNICSLGFCLTALVSCRRGAPFMSILV